MTIKEAWAFNKKKYPRLYKIAVKATIISGIICVMSLISLMIMEL